MLITQSSQFSQTSLTLKKKQTPTPKSKQHYHIDWERKIYAQSTPFFTTITTNKIPHHHSTVHSLVVSCACFTHWLSQSLCLSWAPHALHYAPIVVCWPWLDTRCPSSCSISFISAAEERGRIKGEKSLVGQSKGSSIMQKQSCAQSGCWL